MIDLVLGNLTLAAIMLIAAGWVAAEARAPRTQRVGARRRRRR